MFKFILIIILYMFLVFPVTLNALTEQSEISTEENVKNATDFSLKIKRWIRVETPKIDGRLQVRIDLPQNMEKPFVVKNFEIIIRKLPINNSVNSGYNTVSSAPFILGHTLFSEAQVKKGFLYEVVVNHPVKMAEDQIKTYIIREISSEAFSFSLDKNISSLSFSLPDGLRLKKISDSVLLIENASCTLLNNTINLAPLSEQVIIQYNPFLHHVYLRFSQGLASWNILENSLCKNIPNTSSVIYAYEKQENTITIKHTGSLNSQITVNGNYLNVKFPGAFVKLNNQVNFYKDEFIRAVIWEQDNQNVNLTVCCNQEIEALKKKTLMRKDHEFSIDLQKKTQIVKKKIAAKEKKKKNRLCYEPYISWGKKGFKKEEMYNPGDVAIDKYGFVYVADTFNHQIKKFKLHYSLDKVFGRHGKQQGQFIKPCSIAVGPDNLIYVADMMNNRIQVFDINGRFVRTWGSYGKEYGQLANPLAIEVDKNGIVYVADMNNRITLFNSSGEFIDIFGRGGSQKGEFRSPSALAYDNETGVLYIADKNNNRIQAFYKRKIKKIFKTIKGLPGGLSSPSGIDICGKNLYIADSGNSRLVILDKLSGKLQGVCGKKGSKSGEFFGIRGIAAMNNSLVFIIDRYNNRLQVLKRK